MLHSCAIFNNNTNYNYNSIFTLTPLHPFTIIAPLTTPPLGSYGGQVLSHSARNTSHLAIALPVGRHRQVSIVNQVSTSLGSPRPVSETKGCCSPPSHPRAGEIITLLSFSDRSLLVGHIYVIVVDRSSSELLATL